MSKINLNILTAVCVLITALAGQAGAVTYYVDPNGSKDFMTIQAAINASSNGDEIEVSPGTYNEAINFNGKAVRLYSVGGQDVTTIDAGGSDHVVQCVSGEGASTILEGFTITGGDTTYGGGTYCDNSSRLKKIHHEVQKGMKIFIRRFRRFSQIKERKIATKRYKRHKKNIRQDDRIYKNKSATEHTVSTEILVSFGVLAFKIFTK